MTSYSIIRICNICTYRSAFAGAGAGRGGDADLGRLGAHPVRRPLGHRGMGGRHVLGAGAPVIAALGPDMAGHPLAAMEDLHQGWRQEHIDQLADQAVGDRVEVPLDGDVVIDVDPAFDLPLADDIGLVRQGLQGGPFDGLEQGPAVAALSLGFLTRAGSTAVR